MIGAYISKLILRPYKFVSQLCSVVWWLTFPNGGGRMVAYTPLQKDRMVWWEFSGEISVPEKNMDNMNQMSHEFLHK